METKRNWSGYLYTWKRTDWTFHLKFFHGRKNKNKTETACLSLSKYYKYIEKSVKILRGKKKTERNGTLFKFVKQVGKTLTPKPYQVLLTEYFDF